MSTSYLLVLSILIAVASTSFARILHIHDYNQLDKITNNNETKSLENYVPIPPKDNEKGNLHRSIEISDIRNSKFTNDNYLELNSWKEQKKALQKKVVKSDKKFAKRGIESQVFKNALDETLKMPEDSSLESNVEWIGFEGFPNDRQKSKQSSTMSKSLIETSKSNENEYKLESIQAINTNKAGMQFFDETSSSKEQASLSDDINTRDLKMIEDLEYYKGMPTMGQKLPGPNIKKVSKKLKDFNDEALKNENMWKDFAKIRIPRSD